jgi:hypothetical protein
MAKLVPVDFDPFMGAVSAAPNLIPVDDSSSANSTAVATNLIPVDHDPFDGAGPTATNLIPVDHEPFADDATRPPNLVDEGPFLASAFGATPPTPNPQPGFTGATFSNSPASLLPSAKQSTSAPFSPFSSGGSPPPTELTSPAFVTPVSYAATARPSWFPGLAPALGPAPSGSVWDPWRDQAIKGIQGLMDFLYRSRAKGGGGGGGRDEEDCYTRHEAETGRCQQFYPLEEKRWYWACRSRADTRRDLCIRNRGKPHPDEPPEYNWNDIPMDDPAR